MCRRINLLKLREHPALRKLFIKLTTEEFAAVIKFVNENESLNNDEYMLKANRWYLDQPKPKHYSDMWAIVTQCVNITKKERK